MILMVIVLGPTVLFFTVATLLVLFGRFPLNSPLRIVWRKDDDNDQA